MKVIVLHGEDTAKLTFRLDKFTQAAKDRGWAIKKYDSEGNISIPEFLSSTSLFEKDRLLVVPGQLLTKRDFAWLSKNGQRTTATLVIYYFSEVSKSTLELFPKGARVERFALPKIIFSFFDAFYPGNVSACIKLLHQVLETEPPEVVLSALGKHLRDIYWVKTDSAGLNYPYWRISKLSSVANKFSEEKLASLIGNLAEVDFKSKIGKADVRDSLDLMIISQLE